MIRLRRLPRRAALFGAAFCFQTTTDCVGSARAIGAESAPIAIELKANSCEPGALNLSAGPVAFAIHNSTAKVQEWEILDGVMVIAERENIPPGAYRRLTAHLLPGDYQVACGLLGSAQGRLHVFGQSRDALKVRQSEIIGPLAEYRVFVIDELDSINEAIQSLSVAAEAGKLQDARRLFVEARAGYARISAVAMYFPDLDGIETPGVSLDNPLNADPTSLGFRQLGWELFEGYNPKARAFVLGRLTADMVALQSRFEALSLTPAPTFAGAAQTIGGASIAETAGWRGRVEMAIFEAKLEGVRKIIALFQPLIARSDAQLDRSLAGDFASLAAALSRLGAHDSESRPDNSSDLKLVKALTGKLSTEIDHVHHVLGVSQAIGALQ